MKKEEFQQNMKDRMQQFEDGGLRLLKKGQKGIVHAIFSRFGLVLLLMLLQVGVLWSVFLMIESFPIPVIAAVNGFALGGGNELAMSCDFRICSDNAVFGQPEVGLGITPGFGGTQRLARLVGMGMAKQLVYSALNIKADEAYRIGLVNAVYPQAELMENVLKLANKIAKNAPIAVRNCKKAIDDGISLPIEKAVEVEEKLFGDCFETHDQKEGMACFLSREKPKPKAVFTNN